MYKVWHKDFQNLTTWCLNTTKFGTKFSIYKKMLIRYHQVFQNQKTQCLGTTKFGTKNFKSPKLGALGTTKFGTKFFKTQKTWCKYFKSQKLGAQGTNKICTKFFKTNKTWFKNHQIFSHRFASISKIKLGGMSGTKFFGLKNLGTKFGETLAPSFFFKRKCIFKLNNIWYMQVGTIFRFRKKHGPKTWCLGTKFLGREKLGATWC